MLFFVPRVMSTARAFLSIDWLNEGYSFAWNNLGEPCRPPLVSETLEQAWMRRGVERRGRSWRNRGQLRGAIHRSG
jgi:hypothetical protein